MSDAPPILAERVEMVPVGDLLLHPENARRGDPEAIAESIRVNGWFGTLIVQRSTRYVLVGNHRLLGARLAGLAAVPVMWVDVDDDHARRILLADNRYADLAVWDDRSLLDMLDALPALDGTGFTDLDVELLRRTLDGDDSAPEGRVPSGDVKVQVGTVSFTVTREAWEGFSARLVGEAGHHHDAQVEHVRGLLEI